MGHLVLIVADTLRFPWGSTVKIDPATMPFLAEQRPHAQVLERAVASSPWTVPSHLSLLSGLEPWKMHYHGATLEVPSAPSLGSRWKEAGGEAVAYSANGLVAPEYGFLREYDSLNRFALNRALAPKVWGLLQPLTAQWAGPADLVGEPSPPRSAPRSSFGNLPARCLGGATHAGVHLLTDGRGIAAGVDRFLRRRRAERPLHLFVNLMEAHEPYTLHPGPGSPPLPPELFRPMMGLAPSLPLWKAWPAARPMLERAYRHALSCLDARLRELFGVLSSRSVLRDARVLLVSDHGQALGEGGFFGHGHSAQDEVARIPCLCWEWRRGERVASPPAAEGDFFDHRHLHDALLTLLEKGDGVSLAGGLEEARHQRGPAVCYWEGPSLEDLGNRAPDEARRPPVRSLRLFRGEEDLDLQQDLVEEQGRVLYRPAVPPDPGSLAAEVVQRLGTTSTSSAPASQVPDVVQQRLKSWGYL